MFNNLDDKNILITGASNGIGKQIALSYGKKCKNLIAVGRSQSALEDLDLQLKDTKCNRILVPMDLTNYQLISDLHLELKKRLEKLDVLILNAATIGELTPITHIDENEWNNAFSLNVTSNVLILKIFEDLIQKSNNAQIMILTSDLIHKKKPYWGIYSASKAAMEKIAYSYSSEICNTNIKINLVDPGRINTKLRIKAYPGEDKKSLTQPEDLNDFFLDIIFNENYNNGDLISYEDWKSK